MPPFNDDLANARVITADGTYNDTTTGATNQGPNSPGGEIFDYDDVAVWYRLEWATTGKWRIKVSGVTPLYNANQNLYSSFGSRIYAPNVGSPTVIADLTEQFEDTPRATYVSGDGKGYLGTEDIAQTQEHTAGTVRYIRLGAGQSSGYPFYLWTGNFTIEFEFITPPYNPGGAPANDDMQNATLLNVDNAPVSGTTHGASEDAGSVWYRWEPAEDVVLTVTIEGTEDNGWFPYGDMYHVDGSDPPTSYGDLSNDGWYTWLGDRDPLTGLPINPAYASFALKAGEVYVMEVYDYNNIFSSDFTIKSETNKAPSNDRIENARLISPSTSWPQVIHGTTLYASQDIDEVINWDGSMTPSVWFLLDNKGPGAMSFIIESDPRPDDPTDPGDFPMEAQLFYNASDHTVAGITSMDDLSEDGSQAYADTHLGYLDLRRYGMFYGFETNNPASSAYDWDPLVGGEKFYLRVSAYNYEGQYDAGGFKLTVFVAPEATCLDAQDYLNGASTTASIVSGKVRETQYIPLDQGGQAPHTPKHFQGFFDEMVAAIVIPGEDIASSPGLYSVQIKWTDATNSYQWVAGMRRNGQPLWPGAELSDEDPPWSDWMTMMAGAPYPNELDMVRYLPVQPGDEIEFLFGLNDYDNNGGSGGHLDIDKICFQRMRDAKEGEPYAHAAIPDYPLGTTSSDIGTNDQQGDLVLYKDTPPGNYTQHRVAYTCDMVTTDDGTLYVLYQIQETGFSGKWIGPILAKWTGSAWSIINDDIEGLGVESIRSTAFTASASSQMSLDTDGTDIWVCYCVDGGVNGPGTAHSSHIRVKKYDVGGNSWSNVGSPFYGSRSDIFPTSVPSECTAAIAGDFGETPLIRVSPAGVPWVAFTDFWVPDNGYPEDFASWSLRTYVARWTGSTWDVQLLPGPYESVDTDYSFTKYDESNGSLGATASTTTYLGVACIKETQTAPTNDTLSFTPPAGKWCWKYRYALEKPSGSSAAGVRVYKNGVLVGGVSWQTPGTLAPGNTTPIAWTRFGFFSTAYIECNGSDVISIRLWTEGTGTRNFYLDYVGLMDAHAVNENTGFGFNTRFNDDGQAMAILYMHQVGDVGMGENPGVLYTTSYTRPFLTVAERDAADPPLGWNSMAELNHASDGDSQFPTHQDSMVLPPETQGNYLWNWQTWIYAEWDGSQWVKKWNKLIEEDAPDHVYVRTIYDSIASTPPVGHAQEGFGGDTDGIDNYMTANLFGGQAFGFFGDTVVCLKIGDEGFVPFTDGPPGALQGPGYPQGTVFGLFGFSGWGWTTTGRSMHVDVNGNVWVAWNGTEGAAFNYSDFVAVATRDGVTGNKGLCGWFSASDVNESMGNDNTYAMMGHVVTSPDGDTLYIMFDAFLWSDQTSPLEPYTFGVWEAPITQHAHIPLITIATFKNVSFSSVMEAEALHQPMRG